MRRPTLARWAIAAACLWPACSVQAGDPLALWDKSLNLRGGFGYKDNVLLSASNEQSSAFWQSAFDYLVFRASLDPAASTFTFFVSGEDRRYFESIEVEKEQQLISQAKWEKPVFGEWKGGGLVQYAYADQVFDASATEQLLETIPVKSHSILAAPLVLRELPGSAVLQFRLNIERQYFNEPLDDYWETGPELTYRKTYGNKSEWTAGYTFDHRRYDERRQFGLNARSIPDTSLRYDQHEAETSVLHVWDEARHWRSRVRFGFEWNDDNGPGYYDYRRYRVSKSIGFYGEEWQATLTGKILHYDYLRQPVAVGGDVVRQVWEYVVGARAEKLVWKTLRAFVEAEQERVSSNYRLEEYVVNTVFGGVDWEF